MTRKGQAAVEFLMTYGWAILAAVIAIGVLAYFGVFSPGKYISGTAIVNAPFYVNAWNIKADVAAGEINLELRNNGGEDYVVDSIVIDNGATPAIICTCDGAPPTGLGCPDTVSPSEAVSFNMVCNAPLISGDTYKGDITVNYNKVNSLIALTATGTIAEKITAP